MGFSDGGISRFSCSSSFVFEAIAQTSEAEQAISGGVKLSISVSESISSSACQSSSAAFVGEMSLSSLTTGDSELAALIYSVLFEEYLSSSSASKYSSLTCDPVFQL